VKILLIVVGVALFFGMLAYMTMGQRQFRVEVCMEFNRRQNCGVAAGATKNGALRTATENACALISSGVGETIACGNKQPESVKWFQQ
jgi:hypothetical protein